MILARERGREVDKVGHRLALDLIDGRGVIGTGKPSSSTYICKSCHKARVARFASGSWEHVFVAAPGSALTRYRRALERRHIFGAEIAAKAMAFLSLRDPLGLLALYAAEGPPKLDKASSGGSAGSRLSLATCRYMTCSGLRPRFMLCLVARIRRCRFSGGERLTTTAGFRSGQVA